MPLFSSILNTLNIKANNTNSHDNYNIPYRALYIGKQMVNKDRLAFVFSCSQYIQQGNIFLLQDT